MFVAIGLAVILVGCSSPEALRLLQPGDVNFEPKGPTPVKNRQGEPQPKSAGKTEYQLFKGEAVDGGAAGDLSSGTKGVEQDGDKFSINVDAADVGQVAKLVLGDTLGFNYIVDPRVQGTITLATIRPMTSSQVLSAFEASLRLAGATLIDQSGTYMVVPLQEVLEGQMGSVQRGKAGAEPVPGYGVSIVPLRFISPANLLGLLDSFISRGGTVRASNVNNMILVRGSGVERQQLTDVILSFDVDWMKSQTASIAILTNSKPADIVPKLQSIFAQDSNFSGTNALKVIALEKLNGVVIIANSKEKIRRALGWVQKLDRKSDTESDYYVYNVQNGSAINLAKILNDTFTEQASRQASPSQVDPTQEVASLATGEQVPPVADDKSQPGQAQTPQSKPRVDAAATDQASIDKPSADASGAASQPATRITANPETNTIVIRATPPVYRKILDMLRQIDKQAVQVLVNATIAEVQLNNNLQYGVQAYLRNNSLGGGFSAGNSISISPSVPGFNFLVGAQGNPTIVLQALSAVTNVKVVSSPSVVVLENESATIKVGDSVPITVSQQQSNLQTSNIINSITYRDAGVILKVKPRISSNGMVTMIISQELSQVVNTTTTDTLTPSFSQRTIASTVSIPSSQTVVLGGLISEQDTRSKSSLPGFSKIPIVGDLFGQTQNTNKRNELIVFITPQIIQNGQDAHEVSEELARKMQLFK